MTDARITNSSNGIPFDDDPDHGRVLIAGSTTGNAYSLMEWVVSPRPVIADGQHGFVIEAAEAFNTSFES